MNCIFIVVFYMPFITSAVVCTMCLSIYRSGNDKETGEASFSVAVAIMLHQRYPYLEVVVGLAWSNDPARCASGSVTSDTASHAGQVKGDDPD
jgi:hypothetical protein